MLPGAMPCRLVNSRSLCGYSPLHYAVWNSSLGAVQALLGHGALQDVRNTSSSDTWLVCHIIGCTPLHLAAVRGDVEAARMLLVDYVSGAC